MRSPAPTKPQTNPPASPDQSGRPTVVALRVLGRVARTLDASAKTRRTSAGLFAVLAYLLIGRAIDPGFTEYWWYQLLQTSAILCVVLTLETMFADEGGLAWQTHGIALLTTYADVAGTANGFYDSFAPYDKIVHFWSGAAFAATVYEVLRLLDRRGTIVCPPTRRTLIALAVSFALAGVAWEIYEQLSDVVFNSGRVQSNLDTVGDLICDAGGGMAALVLLRRRETSQEQINHRLTTYSEVRSDRLV